jgi:hypothetical protein
LIRAGHEIAMPWRVPPKCEAICLVHWNGVSKAQAQPTAMCGKVWSVPQASYSFIMSAMEIGMPCPVVSSAGVPMGVPSGLVPLSPSM